MYKFSRGIFISVSVSASLAAAILPAKAEGASWGCQVLLCAASPQSWRSISYCVPPMTKLITAMKRPGFSWPVCKESKTGEPGYEPFEPCKNGFKLTKDKSSRGSICRRVVKGDCRTGGFYRPKVGGISRKKISSERSVCSYEETSAPVPRAKPYYFNIPDQNGTKQQFWFELNH